MYIEFDLPQGAGGMAAGMVNRLISNALNEWSIQHDIPFKSKLVKYKKRITFDDDSSYVLFSLTWTPKTKHSFWLNYRIIRDLNNKI